MAQTPRRGPSPANAYPETYEDMYDQFLGDPRAPISLRGFRGRDAARQVAEQLLRDLQSGLRIPVDRLRPVQEAIFDILRRIRESRLLRR